MLFTITRCVLKCSCLLLLMALITMPQAASSQDKEKEKDPFTFQSPTDWRGERIPFPLDFAPDIDYQGFEELRFAPGMFKTGTDSYFSYVFFWWLPGDVNITSARLKEDLVKYFRGLTAAVAKSRKAQYDLNQVRATVTEIDGAKLHYPARHFLATVETFDPFATQKPVTIQMEIARWHCRESNYTCVFFSASAQPPSTEVWSKMRKIRDSFRCR
jgi:hypothetical protein